MEDATDEKILLMLRRNARATNVEMARAVGLTEGAVRHRIQNLVKSGTIKGFTVELSAAKGIFAVVMVKSRGETKKMMAGIAAGGMAEDAYEISGEYDGCIILRGASVDEIDRKIDGLRKLKEVADTRTFMSFRRW